MRTMVSTIGHHGAIVNSLHFSKAVTSVFRLKRTVQPPNALFELNTRHCARFCPEPKVHCSRLQWHEGAPNNNSTVRLSRVKGKSQGLSCNLLENRLNNPASAALWKSNYSSWQRGAFASGSFRTSPDDSDINAQTESDDEDEGTCRVIYDDDWTGRAESWIEQAIFNCRFLTVMAVAGSLAGSVLCFLQGCYLVALATGEYFATLTLSHAAHGGAFIFSLIEAIDVYLMGTVLLIFGMGLHNLFISAHPSNPPMYQQRGILASSLFGMFRLVQRPSWVKITSLGEMKTKLGHVIVMILLVGMFKEAKKVTVTSGVDLVAFALSIALSSGSLYLLHLLWH